MIWDILMMISGIVFIGFGIRWNKNIHEDNIEDISSASAGSLIGDIFIYIIGHLPWYILKTFLILIGGFFICAAMFN